MSPMIPRRIELVTIASSTLFVLPASAQLINEEFKLTASDAAASDAFGISIAIDNNIVAVGASDNTDNGIGSGSAYLFDATTGNQLFKLLPDDGLNGDHFGNAIAIDNNIVAISASGADRNTLVNVGAVYLFNATTGTQLTKLFASDYGSADLFGYSVAIDNGIVAIGARADEDNGVGSGSAYVFDAATGQQLFKLLPNDGAPSDQFGWAISIDNGIVVVGALGDDDNGNNSGSIYLFDATTGVQLFKLFSNDIEAGDQFGYSVAIDNGIVAVGATGHDDFAGTNNAGAAYLFDASTGAQIGKLLRNDDATGDQYGFSISIDSGIVAVGARYDRDNGSQSGSAYLFDASTGAQLNKLLPSDGASGDQFGWSIAISNATTAVGAYHDDDAGSNSGSAYLFNTSEPCPADLTGDGMLDFFDISAFLTNMVDYNNDTVFDFFDIAAFLQDYSAGCP